jgi:hypothetical protein
MSCCEATGNGQSTGTVVDELNVFPIDVETDDDTPVVLPWGELPVDGAGIVYEGRIGAVSDDGGNGQYAFIGGMVARNASGVATRTPIVGGDAYTPPGAPWATIAAPGWTMDPDEISGTTVQVRLVGAIGMTVRWSGWIARRFIGGATP